MNQAIAYQVRSNSGLLLASWRRFAATAQQYNLPAHRAGAMWRNVVKPEAWVHFRTAAGEPLSKINGVGPPKTFAAET